MYFCRNNVFNSCHSLIDEVLLWFTCTFLIQYFARLVLVSPPSQLFWYLIVKSRYCDLHRKNYLLLILCLLFAGLILISLPIQLFWYLWWHQEWSIWFLHINIWFKLLLGLVVIIVHLNFTTSCLNAIVMHFCFIASVIVIALMELSCLWMTESLMFSFHL